MPSEMTVAMAAPLVPIGSSHPSMPNTSMRSRRRLMMLPRTVTMKTMLVLPRPIKNAHMAANRGPSGPKNMIHWKKGRPSSMYSLAMKNCPPQRAMGTNMMVVMRENQIICQMGSPILNFCLEPLYWPTKTSAMALIPMAP